MTSITEITVVGGDRHLVEGDATDVEKLLLAAARGSLMEFAWLTEADTGKRLALNPDQVVMLRALESPSGGGADGHQQSSEQAAP